MLSAVIYPFIVSFIASFIIIYLSHKYTLFIDEAGHSKPQAFHINNTPRAGGMAILIAMLILFKYPLAAKLFIPIFLAFLSGIFEDFHHTLNPKMRLILQIVAALSAIWLLHAVVLYLGLGITMPYWLGIFFSTFAIVGMMNAINIIDGFNGLAAGMVAIILLSFSMTAYKQNDMEILTVIFITGGALGGFALLNFPKGKIFLGDGGAYMLGFIVAIIGIFLAGQYASVSPWYILAVFIYPVWEVLFSIGRKLYNKQSPMQPDSYHMHMLIYRQITHNNPLTSALVLAAVLPFVTLSTLFPNKSNANIAIAFGFILCYLLLYAYLYQKDTTQQ